MSNLQRISDAVIQLASVKPITGAATYTTGYVEVAQELELLAIINAGVIGTAVNAKLVQATDNSGTAKKDVAGRAITAMTTGAESARIEYRQDDQIVDSAGGFTHVAVEITTTGATTAVSCVVIGGLKGLSSDDTDESSETIKQVI